MDEECFVCTETVPRPWRSPCLCTDRFIHEACQRTLIRTSASASCPACAAPYTNVVAVTRRRIDWYSGPVVLWFLACMLLLLTGAAINTGVNLGLRKARPSARENSGLVLASAIFAAMAGVGWIVWCLAACVLGWRGRRSCTVAETTHCVLSPPPP